MTVERILAMRNWSKEEAEKVLLKENYELMENEFIDDLEALTIERAKELQPGSAQIVSFFLADYIVNISASRAAAWDAARYAVRDAGRNTAWNAAMDAAWSAGWHAALNAAMIAVWDTARDAARTAAKDTVNKIVSKLQLVTHEEIGNASWQLANLYVLAYIAQNEFQNKYFLGAYHAAFKKLNDDPNFKLAPNDVINIIGKCTWLKTEELAKNPYIASLERILKAIPK
jgi:hypothetical protein